LIHGLTLELLVNGLRVNLNCCLLIQCYLHVRLWHLAIARRSNI